MSKKKGKVNVCLLAGTNSAKDDVIDAGTLHAQNYDTAEAWTLNANQQCKDEKSGEYIQFIGSSHCDPIRIYRNHGSQDEDDTNLSALSSDTEDKEMAFLDRGKEKDSRLLWIGICAAMLTLTVCIIALIVIQHNVGQ